MSLGLGQPNMQYHRRVYTLFVILGNFSKNRERFRDKRPGAMPRGSQNFTPLSPPFRPSFSPLFRSRHRFGGPSRYFRHARATTCSSHAGIELTSRGINWYRQPCPSLRLNTPGVYNVVRLNHTRVGMSPFILVRGFSTVLHNAQCR